MDEMNTKYKYIITSIVLNTLLHHVVMSCIILSNNQLKYNMDKHSSDWITSGPWYNTSICKKLHGKMFEEFIINSRTDRYNFKCYIDDHEKNNPAVNDDGIIGGGYPIPLNSTTEELVSLIATIHFISFWLQALEFFFLERFNMYFFVMKNMFQKIPVELPKPPPIECNNDWCFYFWTRWFRKFNWYFLKHIFHLKYTYYRVLEDFVLRLASNNQRN